MAEQPDILARHIRDAAERALPRRRTRRNGSSSSTRYCHCWSSQRQRVGRPSPIDVAGPARWTGHPAESTIRPATPLSNAALLTNARGEPSLGAELRAELVTADEVDLLCAFVKWHGLRILEAQFADSGDGACRCGSSPRPTWEPPSARRWTGWSGVRRRGQDPVRRDANPAARQGVAVPPANGVRHRLRRIVESVPRGPAGRRGVERSAVPRRHADPDGQVRATFDTYWNDGSFEPYDPDQGP